MRSLAIDERNRNIARWSGGTNSSVSILNVNGSDVKYNYMTNPKGIFNSIRWMSYGGFKIPYTDSSNRFKTENLNESTLSFVRQTALTTFTDPTIIQLASPQIPIQPNTTYYYGIMTRSNKPLRVVTRVGPVAQYPANSITLVPNIWTIITGIYTSDSTTSTFRLDIRGDASSITPVANDFVDATKAIVSNINSKYFDGNSTGYELFNAYY